MQRDLEQEKPAPPVPFTESPNSVTTERSESPSSQSQEESASPSTDRQLQQRGQFVIVPESQQVKAPTNLHPYTRPLTISDLDSCVALENAAFTNPEERATREKVS